MKPGRKGKRQWGKKIHFGLPPGKEIGAMGFKKVIFRYMLPA